MYGLVIFKRPIWIITPAETLIIRSLELLLIAPLSFTAWAKSEYFPDESISGQTKAKLPSGELRTILVLDFHFGRRVKCRRLNLDKFSLPNKLTLLLEFVLDS